MPATASILRFTLAGLLGGLIWTTLLFCIVNLPSWQLRRSGNPSLIRRCYGRLAARIFLQCDIRVAILCYRDRDLCFGIDSFKQLLSSINVCTYLHVAAPLVGVSGYQRVGPVNYGPRMRSQRWRPVVFLDGDLLDRSISPDKLKLLHVVRWEKTQRSFGFGHAGK